jgi:hypothetical protein
VSPGAGEVNAGAPGVVGSLAGDSGGGSATAGIRAVSDCSFISLPSSSPPPSSPLSSSPAEASDGVPS